MVKEVNFQVGTCNSRRELRDIVLHQLMEEEPGKGGGDLASRYRYNVETLSDGKRVYLTRPAYLKKGFDFRINVEDLIFSGTGKEYPKHEDIFDDLKRKKAENPLMARKLHSAIGRVYNCEDPDTILREDIDFTFKTGYPIDLILKVIKWFLIEQDIRDWNYSGRQMFKEGIDAILLK
jgi:hypothetical protein